MFYLNVLSGSWVYTDHSQKLQESKLRRINSFAIVSIHHFKCSFNFYPKLIKNISHSRLMYFIFVVGNASLVNSFPTICKENKGKLAAKLGLCAFTI